MLIECFRGTGWTKSGWLYAHAFFLLTKQIKWELTKTVSNMNAVSRSEKRSQSRIAFNFVFLSEGHRFGCKQRLSDLTSVNAFLMS